MAVAAHHELITASSTLRHAGKDGALTAFCSSQCEGLKRVNDEGRPAFAAAATKALAFDECVESALYMLDSTPEQDANAAMVAALGRLVRDPKQKVNKLVKALVRAMAQRSTPGRARPMLDALAASTAARAQSLADVLFALRDDEGDRALVAWVDGLDDRDLRKSALGEARSRFKQRIARKTRCAARGDQPPLEASESLLESDASASESLLESDASASESLLESDASASEKSRTSTATSAVAASSCEEESRRCDESPCGSASELASGAASCPGLLGLHAPSRESARRAEPNRRENFMSAVWSDSARHAM
jgi:hypothetical protein